MKVHPCDILVVGAGPAGSSAAIIAAREGVNVKVIERRETIGVPVQCAEYIPAQLLGKVDGKTDFVVQPIQAMRTYFPDGSFQESKNRGFTINRDQFDQYLARQAENAGASILTGACARDFNNGKVTIEFKHGGFKTFLPKVIIGADGPRSTVAKWAGFNRPKLIPAIQIRASLKKPMDITEIYFQPEIYGGYGWLFPKGKHANVGIGIKPQFSDKISIKEKFNRFIDYLSGIGKISVDGGSYSFGMIPVSVVHKIVQDNMVLVGDAAGHTHPITGAGISPAVIGGQIAGKWAAQSIKQKKNLLLQEYANEWDELFDEPLKKASIKRQIMEMRWDELNTVIRYCWPGFREYYASS